MSRPVRQVAVGALAAGLLATVLGGCASLIETQPSPTPTDFGGIVAALGNDGIAIANPHSGDAGCSDPSLIPTAIAFTATGAGVTSPMPLRIYIFGNDASYQRLRSAVDACAAQWASDPAAFEFVDASPYVVAGQGPWPPAFKTAIQHALRVAAGRLVPTTTGAPAS